MKQGTANWSQSVRAWLRSLRGEAEELPPHQRRPFVRRHRGTTVLQFARGVSQSQMLDREPDRLLIDYTRTMLGALVLVPSPRRIGMIGLGGGSQAKFCYRHLPDAAIEVVENNAHVIAMRERFRIPRDDRRFQIVLGDGAEFVRARRGCFDLLLVDGYDETGIPAALASQQFYDDCRAALTQDGALSVNLFCRDAAEHIEWLRRSFGAQRVRVVEETRQSNRVAVAWLRTLATDAAPVLPPAAQRELAFDFLRLRAMGVGVADEDLPDATTAERRVT